MFVSPKSLQLRGDFFYQLGVMTGAGLTLVQALTTLSQTSGGFGHQQLIKSMIARLNAGDTFTETLQSANFTPLEIAVLGAGEVSGRLDVTCRMVAEHHRRNGQMLGQIYGALIYPVLLLHAVVFLFPPSDLAAILMGPLSIPAFLAGKLMILAPMYLAVIGLLWFINRRAGKVTPPTLEKLLALIPFLGAARRSLALGRLADALEALVSAGITIIEAWQVAARASGSGLISRAEAVLVARAREGETPGEIMAQLPVFPTFFVQMYQTGEQSGQLDVMLGRISRHYNEEGVRSLQNFAAWMPRLLYALVAGVIVYTILKTWTAHFKTLSDVLN